VTRRADARRNREAILTAARALVGEHGATGLRIADVAAASGVGAGSIYRAVGSRSGLLLALLDEDERELQQQMISGPPPLGPGAPPAERLRAFVTALHELIVRRRELLVAADDTSALAHTRTAVRAGWAAHLRLLLAELLPADADVQIAAELLLAVLSAPTYVHILDDLARTPADLHRELHRLLRLVVDQAP
jgi:AcrR family transcriptional regulator